MNACPPSPPLSLATRLQTHQALAAQLAGLDDAALSRWLAAAPTAAAGIGGRSMRLQLGEREVFAKLIPLSALELEHPGSSANLFGLPTYFQYGIGSVGFGAWRELAAQRMASDWVRSGACGGFPLLHHWRLLRLPAADGPDAAVQDWGADYFAAAEPFDLPGRAQVLARFAAVQRPAAWLVVVMECFAAPVSSWLRAALARGGLPAERAVALVDEGMDALLGFIRRQGFVHFDTHLDNLLTDGQAIYLSDFGLATCPQFALSEEERDFAAAHADYDAARFASSLVQALVTSQGLSWRDYLAAPERFDADALPVLLRSVYQRHAPPALVLCEFARRLQRDSKLSAYPDVALRRRPGLFQQQVQQDAQRQQGQQAAAPDHPGQPTQPCSSRVSR